MQELVVMDVISAVRTVMMMSTIRFNVRFLFSVIMFSRFAARITQILRFSVSSTSSVPS